MKADLEAREEAFKRSQDPNYTTGQTDEEKLKVEIERLKKEGSRLVEEEKERLRQKILEDLRNERSNVKYGSPEECRVKMKWDVPEEDATNGGYNDENLHRFLSKVRQAILDLSKFEFVRSKS